MDAQPASLDAVALIPVSQEQPAEHKPDPNPTCALPSHDTHTEQPSNHDDVSTSASTNLNETTETQSLTELHTSSNISPPPPSIQEPLLTNSSDSPKSPTASSDLSELDPSEFIDHSFDGPDGHRVICLRPTIDQWNDFPRMLGFARRHGAEDDGCFKIILPAQLREPLPEKSSLKVPANAYRPNQIKKNSFWRVNTVPSEGTFGSSMTGQEYTSSAFDALDELRKMFRKNNRKQIRNVRYRVDVPAWTPSQRLAAGVPEQSPIHPLKGDKLDNTRAIIPGIHTPYVYESGPYFGASFQIHAEDFRLVSLNHLYKGRKIWIVVPSTAVDIAEEALGRKQGCSQFMRHRAEFFFPQKLEKLGIPFRIVDQRPGETIVILPDAYHEGFSTGYTLAEAKNYADENWTTDTYQPCEASCQLITAIPADLMRFLREGEARLDLCAAYTPVKPEEVMAPKDMEMPELTKRSLDGEDYGERDIKRVKE